MVKEDYLHYLNKNELTEQSDHNAYQNQLNPLLLLLQRLSAFHRATLP